MLVYAFTISALAKVNLKSLCDIYVTIISFILKFIVHSGIHKLINFSEGVRESLRRLSNVTWMADELHKATYYLFSKSVSLLQLITISNHH